jgi:predicted nucleic acid-binding protein
VTIDVISSEGEADILKNLQRKSDAASQMFEQLVSLMNDELKIKQTNEYTKKNTTPSWL